MTFYEAALRILEEAGQPLSHIDIANRSIEKGLLSHIGKTPELTMLARLAAMAKRPRDKRVVVTAKDTFGLTEWQIPEDPVALEATGVIVEAPDADNEAPLRPVERHPEIRPDMAKSLGRTSDRGSDRRHREDEGRRRKFPPIPEVIFEVLSSAGTRLLPEDALAKAKERELVSPEATLDQIFKALVQENQDRIDSGRVPQFVYSTFQSDVPELSLEPANDVPGIEIQKRFCELARIPFENGRVGGRPSSHHHEDRTAVIRTDTQGFQQVRNIVRENKREVVRQISRKLEDLDMYCFQKAAVRLLFGLHFKEVKIVKRHDDGVVALARRREGNLELRYGIRIYKSQPIIDRAVVAETRDLIDRLGVHVGLLCALGEVKGDARAEAVAQAPLIYLWCGDALAEKFVEAEVGVRSEVVEMYELDSEFFIKAKRDGEDARARRQETRDDRGAQRHSGRAEPVTDVPEKKVRELGAVDGEADDSDGPEDDPTAEMAVPAEGAAQNPTGRKRRRRRRRGRGGDRPGMERPVGAPVPGQEVKETAAVSSAPIEEEPVTAVLPVPETTPTPSNAS